MCSHSNISSGCHGNSLTLLYGAVSGRKKGKQDNPHVNSQVVYSNDSTWDCFLSSFQYHHTELCSFWNVMGLYLTLEYKKMTLDELTITTYYGPLSPGLLTAIGPFPSGRRLRRRRLPHMTLDGGVIVARFLASAIVPYPTIPER